MPETCENWLGLVNSCVYYARQTRENHQVLPYSVDFKALGELVDGNYAENMEIIFMVYQLPFHNESSRQEDNYGRVTITRSCPEPCGPLEWTAF